MRLTVHIDPPRAWFELADDNGEPMEFTAHLARTGIEDVYVLTRPDCPIGIVEVAGLSVTVRDATGAEQDSWAQRQALP